MEGYLRQFVNEVNSLYDNGLDINDRNIPVKIRAFICDASAQAHLKGNFFYFKSNLNVLLLSIYNGKKYFFLKAQ